MTTEAASPTDGAVPSPAPRGSSVILIVFTVLVVVAVVVALVLVLSGTAFADPMAGT